LQPSKGGPDIYTITAHAKPHPITHLQGDNTIIFDQARPVNISQSPPESTSLEPLLETGAEGWHLPVEEFTKALAGRQKITVGAKVTDLAAQLLGVAVMRQQHGKPIEQATRIVAVGNGNFVSSRYMDQNSWLFFLNAVNWMTNSADLIAIPSSKIENTPVEITQPQARFLFILLVIAVPAIIGLGGLGYAITRRGQLNNR
jgi:hypothetical protein